MHNQTPDGTPGTWSHVPGRVEAIQYVPGEQWLATWLRAVRSDFNRHRVEPYTDRADLRYAALPAAFILAASADPVTARTFVDIERIARAAKVQPSTALAHVRNVIRAGFADKIGRTPRGEQQEVVLTIPVAFDFAECRERLVTVDVGTWTRTVVSAYEQGLLSLADFLAGVLHPVCEQNAYWPHLTFHHRYVDMPFFDGGGTVDPEPAMKRLGLHLPPSFPVRPCDECECERCGGKWRSA